MVYPPVKGAHGMETSAGLSSSPGILMHSKTKTTLARRVYGGRKKHRAFIAVSAKNIRLIDNISLTMLNFELKTINSKRSDCGNKILFDFFIWAADGYLRDNEPRVRRPLRPAG